MSIREFFLMEYHKYQTRQQLYDAAEAAGLGGRRTIQNTFSEAIKKHPELRVLRQDYPKRKEQPIQETIQQPERPKMGISKTEFLKKYDLKTKIEDAVKQLRKDVILTDTEFIQIHGIRANPGFRQVLDHPDFAMYRGKAGGIIHWSHRETISELKNEGVMI